MKRINFELRILKALSSEKRLEIVHMLENKELKYIEIYTLNKEVTMADISKHLRILRDAGIIDYKHVGKDHLYYIVNEKIFKVLRLIDKMSL